MIKMLLLAVLVCLGLTACIENDESTYITDDNGYVHHTTHYLRDKRGQKYFPMKMPATGQKEFIFDPKAFAWAAYDAEGHRVMTGAASGGKDICEGEDKTCRTVTGTFRVYNKRGVNCKSGEYPVETEGDIIKKIPIMGDGHHGSWKVMQKMFKPCHTFSIQMVGWLIEQQHVWF